MARKKPEKAEVREFMEIGGSPVPGITLRQVLRGHTDTINREEIDLFDNIRDKIAKLTPIPQDLNILTPDMHRDSEFQSLFDAVMEKLEE